MQGRRGQSSLELAVMVAALVGGLVTMAVYLKRAIMGNLRGGANQIGEQYEPRRSTALLVETASSASTTHTVLVPDQDIGGGIIADITVSTTETPQDLRVLSGTETVGPLGRDLWDLGEPVQPPL
jgi:hypothetical protein